MFDQRFVIPDEKRTVTLEKMLSGMQRRDLDAEIAKRLKYSQGTTEEFIDHDELDIFMEGISSEKITDKYILSKIDKTGNQGSNLCLNRNGQKRAGKSGCNSFTVESRNKGDQVAQAEQASCKGTQQRSDGGSSK